MVTLYIPICGMCGLLETCIFFSLRNSISLEPNQFFLGTQAFASPTDMASSGVWDWQKLVFPEKNDSVQEKLSSLMKIKQNEKSTFIYALFCLWTYVAHLHWYAKRVFCTF